MINYPHPIIAREGWLFLAISSVTGLIAHRFLCYIKVSIGDKVSATTILAKLA